MELRQAWIRNAPRLAEWAGARLVNRRDAYGAYRREEEIGKEYQRQDGSKGTLGEQLTLKERLTPSILIRHFRATGRPAIIGLHAASADNLSLWGALDIDFHGPTSTAPEINQRAASWWYGVLVRHGFRPLLTESNGKGGYHLRVLLAEPIPGDRLFLFLKSLTADHGQLGFAKAPEQFPKQPDVRQCKKGFGNWLRLPGRHHKRPYWSRVWDGERWLDGAEAVAFILSLTGDPAQLVPDVPPPAPKPQARRLVNRTFVFHPDNLSARVAAYMRKLPNAGEGGGRDDIAFRFAAWLVRDMNLSDSVALDWLEQWDRGNNPPKGRDCLAEILANAHEYGTHAVGSGLNCEPATAGGTPRSGCIIPTRRPGHVILRCCTEVG
jgi:putative DNA primase/helicase